MHVCKILNTSIRMATRLSLENDSFIGIYGYTPRAYWVKIGMLKSNPSSMIFIAQCIWETCKNVSWGREGRIIRQYHRWVHPHLALERCSQKRNALLFVAPFLSTLQIRDFGPYGLKILLGSIGTSFSAKYFVHTTSYIILQKSTSIVKLWLSIFD